MEIDARCPRYAHMSFRLDTSRARLVCLQVLCTYGSSELGNGGRTQGGQILGNHLSLWRVRTGYVAMERFEKMIDVLDIHTS
jgi:hypothetical protein